MPLSRPTVFHLAGSDGRTSGIATYANLLDNIFGMHLGASWVVKRISPLNFREEISAAEPDDLVLVQLGTNEDEVFFALNDIAREFPTIRKIIEIHDPPHFSLTLNRIVKFISRSRVGRGIRRLHHRLFEDRYVATILRPGDILVSKSEAGRAALESRMNTLSLKIDVVFIPHPVYSDRCKATASSQTTAPPTVGFFGYINHDKGLHLVVDAAADIARRVGIDAVPVVKIRGSTATAEQARYLNMLKSTAFNNGLASKIQFGEFMDEEEIPNFYAGITALVLPYTSEGRKSASGPLMWAVTCGRPVIAHKTSFFCEFLEANHIGVAISMQSATEWRSVLLDVATNREWHLNYSGSLLAAQRRYSWKETAARYEKLFVLCRGERSQAFCGASPGR